MRIPEKMPPLPWRWDDTFKQIVDAVDDRVVETDSGVYGPTREVAEYICEAVNRHEELVRLNDEAERVIMAAHDDLTTKLLSRFITETTPMLESFLSSRDIHFKASD